VGRPRGPFPDGLELNGRGVRATWRHALAGGGFGRGALIGVESEQRGLHRGHFADGFAPGCIGPEGRLNGVAIPPDVVDSRALPPTPPSG